MRRITVYSVPRILRCMLAAAMVCAGIGGVNSASADEIVGNAIVARGATDGAVGSIFMHDQTFSTVGTLQNWSFFHQDAGLTITPVIYELTGGQYTITGIGATRPVTGAGSQTFDFDLVSGSAAVGPNSFFGWKDGGNGTNNLGVPEYDDGGSTADWLGPNNTSFSVGQTLGVAAGGLPRTYSMSASTVDGASTAVETAGNPIVNRSLTDGAVGSLFVMRGSPFTAAGTVDSWSFFNDNFVAPPQKQITPMIVENVGGSFVVTGIGATRTSTGTGAQDYSFDLVAGSAEVGPGKFLAWKDGSNGADNAGVAPFDQNLGQSVRWFGGGHTAFAAGENLGAGQAFRAPTRFAPRRTPFRRPCCRFLSLPVKL